MSNKHFKFATGLMLHLGIILTLEGDMGMVKTKLLGSAIAQGIAESAPIHLMEQHASFAGWNLSLGIAMILVGFGMHAWITKREERPVKVHAVKKKPKKSLFWVRLHI